MQALESWAGTKERSGEDRVAEAEGDRRVNLRGSLRAERSEVVIQSAKELPRESEGRNESQRGW